MFGAQQGAENYHVSYPPPSQPKFLLIELCWLDRTDEALLLLQHVGAIFFQW